MIIADSLKKSYRNKIAVDNISFSIEEGKVTGFLGPNGAGKSTTMRLMLGLDRGSGTTTFDGKKLVDHAMPNHMVGVLLESKAFHPTRTARNHLRVLAINGGVDDKRVDEVLDIVGLSKVDNMHPGKFSLGMSQRLGIAGAILTNPKYLILDEPANGLDPEGIHWLRQFLKDYASTGKGVFVSSHLLSEMSLMAENIIVIGKGKLISSGSVSDIINQTSDNKVFVRSNKLEALERLIKQKFAYDKSEGGLIVHDVTPDELGKIAFDAKIPILELSKRSASLEDAFLDITSDSQEYKSASKIKQRGAKK